MNTDGNLAALNAYQREQDELAEAEARLEALRELLSEDLFEAYFDDNEDVIAEVFDSIVHTDEWAEAMLDGLRHNFTQDGVALRNTYQKYIAKACDSIAERCEDMDAIERYYRDFKL